MAKPKTEAPWHPGIAVGDPRPVYLAIVEAIEADLRAGRLPAGTRLPPQRSLAAALGIDFTTVSRAYSEAARRGLVEGRVGQGTFVRAAPPPQAPAGPGEGIDMGMNQPPLPPDLPLNQLVRDAMQAVLGRASPELLFRYQEAGGSRADRQAGAHWLSRSLGLVPEGRILICSGAQGALLAVLGTLCQAGDLVCCEALTYPGFRSLAAHLRLRLAPLPMDEQGLLPEAFERFCAEQEPRALYLTPTLHNPTTATLPLARRQALLATARRHGVPVIEDDAYGMLASQAPPPLAALGPDITYHIAGLAKCLSPALRLAYLVMPEGGPALRLAAAIRATTGMAPPLMVALASQWIADGTASAVLRGIRAETARRQALALAMLPPGLVTTAPDAFHLWLKLPGEWTRAEFIARLRSAGIGVVGSDAFAVGPAPEAVRIGLGASSSAEALQRGLRVIGDLLAAPPAMSSLVV